MILAMSPFACRVIGVLWLGVVASGCATVRPWEKGTLAQPAMNPSAPARVAAAEFTSHALDTREGSSGGTGAAGGGCGCN